MWVTKLLISQVKKKDFLPQNDQIWPKIGIFGQFGPGHAGFFSALLVGRLVVVARGLYLARHLFTLSYFILHTIFCKVCGKENKMNDIKPHIEDKHFTGFVHPCGVCGKTLASRYKLARHRTKQHGKQMFC